MFRSSKAVVPFDIREQLLVRPRVHLALYPVLEDGQEKEVLRRIKKGLKYSFIYCIIFWTLQITCIY